MSSRLEVWAPDGVPEVAEGDDLAALVLAALRGDDALADGDVLCVTSKVVSKAEGRVRAGDRDAAVEEETVRVVARRGPVTIVRNRLGLTMAAAGVDASNVAAGSIVLLPRRPRRLGARAAPRGAPSAPAPTSASWSPTPPGRAWREGQTDIAIGAAGLLVAEDFAGRTDPHGNAARRHPARRGRRDRRSGRARAGQAGRPAGGRRPRAGRPGAAARRRRPRRRVTRASRRWRPVRLGRPRGRRTRPGRGRRGPAAVRRTAAPPS